MKNLKSKAISYYKVKFGVSHKITRLASRMSEAALTKAINEFGRITWEKFPENITEYKESVLADTIEMHYTSEKLGIEI
jgi:hypothetical protein